MKKTSAPLATACAFEASIGKLHLCPFGEGGVNLRDLLEDDTQQQALEARISAALREKKQTHFASKQHRYYAKLIVHWRLKRQKRRDQMSQVSTEFIPTRIAILTVSNRRGEEDDT